MMEQSIKKQVIQRNVRFWGKQAVQMFLMMVAMIALYSIFFASTSGRQNVWSSVLYYMVIMGLMFAFMLPATTGGQFFSMIVSMGGKRRETVWGIQFMNLVFALQYMVVVTLGRGMEQGMSTGFFRQNGLFLGMFGEAVVFSQALGQFAAAANLKFGKKGIWTVVIGILVIMTIGVGVGLSSLEFFGTRFETIRGNWNTVICSVGGIAAVLLYMLGAMVLFRVAQKYEVRA